jgi:hypothetical protein
MPSNVFVNRVEVTKSRHSVWTDHWPQLNWARQTCRERLQLFLTKERATSTTRPAAKPTDHCNHSHCAGANMHTRVEREGEVCGATCRRIATVEATTTPETARTENYVQENS